VFLLSVAISFTAHAQSFTPLPDAPLPRTARAESVSSVPQMQTVERDSQNPPRSASPKAASPIERAPFETRKWAQYIDPGERIPPLYAKDKWVFWLHQEVRLESALPAFLSAGYGQLSGVPDYGSDEGGFGDRLGAAVIRQASMRFFCNSFFPVVLHEDPRYYRKASGSYKSRAGWAAMVSIAPISSAISPLPPSRLPIIPTPAPMSALSFKPGEPPSPEISAITCSSSSGLT
jgi:hypothetical protein